MLGAFLHTYFKKCGKNALLFFYYESYNPVLCGPCAIIARREVNVGHEYSSSPRTTTSPNEWIRKSTLNITMVCMSISLLYSGRRCARISPRRNIYSSGERSCKWRVGQTAMLSAPITTLRALNTASSPPTSQLPLSRCFFFIFCEI